MKKIILLIAAFVLASQASIGLHAEGLGCGNDKNFRTLRSAMDGSERRTWSSYLARTDSRNSYGVGSEGLGFKASASGPRESAKPAKPSKPVSAKTWHRVSMVGLILGSISAGASLILGPILASLGHANWAFLPFGLAFAFFIAAAIAEHKMEKASKPESLKEYLDRLKKQSKR